MKKYFLRSFYLILLLNFFVFASCSSSYESNRLLPTSDYRIVDSTLPVELRWHHQFDENILNPPITYSFGMVYIRTTNTFYALDASTGEVQWKHKLVAVTPGYDTRELVLPYQDKVFVTNERQTILQALDALSGKVLWDIPFSRYIRPNAQKPTLVMSAADAERIYLLLFLVRGTAVLAINPTDGNLLWLSPQEINTSSPSVMYVDPRFDWLVVVNDRFWYLDKQSGQIVDTKSTLATYRHPTLAKGILYTNGEMIRAVELETLRHVWVTANDCSDRSDENFFPVQFIDDSIYAISTCGILYKLRATDGSVQWRFTTSYETDSFVVFDGNGYLLTSDGTLHAIDLANGQSIGEMKVDPPYVAIETDWHLTANQELLILSYGTKQVFAFQAK